MVRISPSSSSPLHNYCGGKRLKLNQKLNTLKIQVYSSFLDSSLVFMLNCSGLKKISHADDR